MSIRVATNSAAVNNGTSRGAPSVAGQLNLETPQHAIRAVNLNIFYGSFQAVRDINLDVERHKITALIGPSGCGKSTVLRSFNRMNDLVPTSRSEGEVLFHGKNIYDPDVDAVEVRRRVGMVFQKPNPFPKSIYENIAWGARINGYKGNMDQLVEESLRGAALWDEVKDNRTRAGISNNVRARLSACCSSSMLAPIHTCGLRSKKLSALRPAARSINGFTFSGRLVSSSQSSPSVASINSNSEMRH